VTKSVVLAVIATALAIAVLDQPLASWLATLEPSPVWERLLSGVEIATGIEPWRWTAPVVLGAGCAIALAVPRFYPHARAWLYVTFVYLASRNAMLWMKTLTGRYRPTEWLAHGGGTFWHIGDGVSFPSGHVVLVAGLIVPVAIVQPRTRPLFAVIAFVMAARLAANVHFLSDVLGGLALVLAIAAAARPMLHSVNE
jgi:membrane-associated phospholipid phosphatase